MRIIAGKHKGRRFSPKAKQSYPTRPTMDYAREALFNILQHQIDFESIKALDLFGGFGGNSFELLSRGCEDVTIVEKHAGCVRFIRETAHTLKEEEHLHILRGDVFQYLKGCTHSFDFIFADPPYQLPTIDLLPELIFSRSLLAPNGSFILEHSNQHTFSSSPRFVEEREYGGTVFSFFE